MCFNGAKTWQLGWFSNYHVDLDPTFSIDWTGDLIGFAEKSSASPTDVMIVRIRSSISQDTYIHFNRQIGFNAEARLSNGGDKVLIATRASYPDFSTSNLTAILGNSDVHMIPNFHGSSNALIISISSIVTNTIPARARVNIRFDSVLSDPLALTTQKPIASPSSSNPFPTKYPTLFPFDGLANPRTLLPSEPPTHKPASIPTRKPSLFPSPLLSNLSSLLPFVQGTISPTRKKASTHSPTRKKAFTHSPTRKKASTHSPTRKKASTTSPTRKRGNTQKPSKTNLPTLVL
jgi:hypothetical protein